MFRTLIVASLRRAWLGFTATFILGGAAFILIDGDDPLRSDDPYVVGFATGAFAAVMGVAYSIAESVCGNRWRTSLAYFALVGAWTVFFIAATARANEGAEMGRFLAIAHASSAVVCWPLFAFRLPKAAVAAISVAGAAALAMYAIVAARMALDH
ncbi:MAG: hypothetical protein WD066_00725 [Planctomycetaceae bacterium]